MKVEKFIPNWTVRISSLENHTSYMGSPALSDNQCLISVWKVMNKVLAAALTVCYSTGDEVFVCVCVLMACLCAQGPIWSKSQEGLSHVLFT